MEINLFVVISTAIGFFVVVFVLRKFAWGPVIAMIDARQKAIDEMFTQLEAKQRDANQLFEDYSTKLRNIEHEANDMLQDAVRKGQELATQLRKEAEAQREKILDKAKAEIAREKQLAQDELRKETIELAFNLTEKILRTKLDNEEQKRLVKQFTGDLEVL